MDGDRISAPVGLLEILRARDPVVLALRIASERHALQPLEVPQLPVPSDALEQLLEAKQPSTVPDELRKEHEAYNQALLARADAKGENTRRLRASLWAEQCLRAHCRPEHALLRAFNRNAWGVHEGASQDLAEREAQVQDHA